VSSSGASLLDYLVTVAAQEVTNPGRAAKIVLALHAAGQNSRDAGGVDLVAAIEGSRDAATGWYGDSFYGHLLAVLALQSQGIPVPQEANDAIISAQVTSDGSWGFSGDTTPGTGDSNTTALAIQTLAALAIGDEAVLAGLDYLRAVQDDGGAIAYDAATLAASGGDANSTALAIQAFVAAGVDPAALPNGDLLAALAAFQNPSGAFQFQPAFPDDSLLATAQAVPALLLKPLPLDPLPARSPLDDAVEPADPLADCSYFDVTQHNVCGVFASFWETHGGLAILGYPLSEAYDELGQRVQYFERARFEHHPDNAGTEWEVLLTRLGAGEVERSYNQQTPRVDANTSCEYHEPTGHNLCGGFGAYWHAFGGLAVFGYPLTEEFQEDGLTVQYFERARFEWHPGSWPERYDVLLGRLGAEAVERELAR
jgi:hypothetical protein